MITKILKLKTGDTEQLAKLNYHESVLETSIQHGWNSIYFSAPIFTLATVELNNNLYSIETKGDVLVADGTNMLSNSEFRKNQKTTRY